MRMAALYLCWSATSASFATQDAAQWQIIVANKRGVCPSLAGGCLRTLGAFPNPVQGNHAADGTSLILPLSPFWVAIESQGGNSTNRRVLCQGLEKENFQVAGVDLLLHGESCPEMWQPYRGKRDEGNGAGAGSASESPAGSPLPRTHWAPVGGRCVAETGGLLPVGISLCPGCASSRCLPIHDRSHL